jgi:putative phosphoribosyl transferase
LVTVAAGAIELEGVLDVPDEARGVAVFAHGSGSGRHSPRNRFVAEVLQRGRIGTLLLDLLTPEEDLDIARRFDIDLLTQRLDHAVQFVVTHAATRALSVGLFGASTGAASALRVAARRPGDVAAVVSRGGRPDLASVRLLGAVRAPTLLIVGGLDHGVIELNESARDALLHCERELVIVPGATHLFEEPGTLDQVAELALRWFTRHLASRPSASRAR